MSAMRLAAGRFERQAKAHETRQNANTIKPALCVPARVGLAIDGRTAQVG
jgi:hypothetical protein